MLDQDHAPKRRVKVDLSELEFVFEDASPEAAHYLDLETGQVVRTTGEIRREMEDIHAQMYGEGDEPTMSFEEALQQRDLPDWMKDELRVADQIEIGYGKRFICVPEADSHEGYRDMEDFVDTLQGRGLQERLWQAIRGRGAFRRFKDTLLKHAQERERWFEFRDARQRQRVLDWLESEGIEPITE